MITTMRPAPILLLLLLVGCALEKAPDDTMLDISAIPLPATVERSDGAFVVDGETTIRSDARRTGELLAEALREATGQPVPLDRSNGRPIRLRLAWENWDLGPEGYRLEVTPERVEIVGPPAGLFRGTQTLRQLLVDGRIPAVRIADRPRFAWRGLHLDVGRHFFPVEDVKRYIDTLAFFRMNTFHWHLTEDQGWRIEIKRYPKLTEIGSKRAESPTPGARNQGDGKPYGGFYTQDEIREIVAYAAERFVTIVPEIEMPGHAQAAIAAYPELGNTGEPLTVRTTWGVSKHVYNVEDSTFEFLTNVLDEVMELFPGEFIHIGGDECPKDEWKASAKAQARMKAEGLEDEHELQSWFIRRIEKHLNANGRRLIGWDEIHEGGLAPNATVMLWRSWAFTPVEAVRLGHDVVMSPNSHCYFDYYQGPAEHEPEAIGGHLPLDRAYSFEPAPAELTDAETGRVLGGQGNLWTEYMPDMDHVFFMAYPRGAALAEVLWSPREDRDFEDFLRRWSRVSLLLDA
ncbi:MAG: beta-N-acetylhexosaminidase, partial [Planctomycetota bacterium]